MVSRSIEGSVIHDTNLVVERSIRMVTEGKVATITGDLIEVEADSICLHGDTPGAVDMATTMGQMFKENDIKIVPLKEMF